MAEFRASEQRERGLLHNVEHLNNQITMHQSRDEQSMKAIEDQKLQINNAVCQQVNQQTVLERGSHQLHDLEQQLIATKNAMQQQHSIFITESQRYP